MMTEQEEEFIHFVLCIEYPNRAWNLINTIKVAESGPLVGFAFRFALVEYSKPYNTSRGTVKKKRKLDTSCIPQTYLPFIRESSTRGIKFMRIPISL
jgi:hypothetical protein